VFEFNFRTPLIEYNFPLLEKEGNKYNVFHILSKFNLGVVLPFSEFIQIFVSSEELNQTTPCIFHPLSEKRTVLLLTCCGEP
jgi:hypothetical protein